jgi:hypothetical protein
VRSWSQELKQEKSSDWLGLTRINLGSNYAWFYPDPPWGRKDVLCPGSRILNYWNMVVWMAMAYVAIAVPFLAAGFTSAYTDVQQLGNRCSDHRRSLMDLVVDLVFLTDIAISFHTAYYRNKGGGNLILVDDLPAIRRHYVRSFAFVWDLLGIIPLKEFFCLFARLAPSVLRTPKSLLGLFKVTPQSPL